MAVVNAAEANRSFSQLLRQVAQGASITALSHGRPAATTGPPEQSRDAYQALRQAPLNRLVGQPASGQLRPWKRDELYD